MEKNPGGKGRNSKWEVIYESLIVADYLDEAYSTGRQLHPTDPAQKAVDRIWVENFSRVKSFTYFIANFKRESRSYC